MTNISLSSQQTNSMHKATRQLLGARWRARLPPPARGVGVVHDSCGRPLSVEQWAMPCRTLTQVSSESSCTLPRGCC